MGQLGRTWCAYEGTGKNENMKGTVPAFIKSKLTFAF